MTESHAGVEGQLVAFLPNMRRFAISLCRSHDIADDLVQQACERALVNASSFQPGTRFDAWIFRILRNLWIDILRRRRSAGPLQDIDEATDISDPLATGTAEARLTLKSVADAIGMLQEEQREVLLLVCVEDMSYKDTAAILDIPIGTVMSRLARARKNLAQQTGIEGTVARSPA